MVQILGITREKIVYIKEDFEGKKKNRFHHIQYGTHGIENLYQFCDLFDDGADESIMRDC